MNSREFYAPSGRTDAVDCPRMTLEAFKPLVKGALRGFATVRLPIGLVIADVPICTSHGKVWASLPSKPILDRDGRHVEDGGKKKYASILQWKDRDTADRWSAVVVELVRRAHPDALNGDAA
jgi:hypothetical protein